MPANTRLEIVLYHSTMWELSSIADKIQLKVGTEVRFDVNYGALLRAMTSPYVEKVYVWNETQPNMGVKNEDCDCWRVG